MWGVQYSSTSLATYPQSQTMQPNNVKGTHLQHQLLGNLSTISNNAAKLCEGNTPTASESNA
jgi:hypothetical protein